MSGEIPGRQIKISTGYERRISIVYQGWTYSVFYEETINALTDDDITKARKNLRLRAMGAVYRDILDDIPRLIQLVETSVATDLRMATQERSKLQGLKSEAEDGLEEVRKRLSESQ